MLRAHIAGNQTGRLFSGRKPLQPKNSPSNPLITNPKNMENPHLPIDDRNKENPHHPIPIEPMMIDASLAEELSSIRRRKERLREERERTEGVMREREMVLERKMEEVIQRGEVQKQLEIEVDRLFRLKEIQLQSKRNSPIQSLREKRQGGRLVEGQLQDVNSGSTSEGKNGSQFQTSSSETQTQN